MARFSLKLSLGMDRRSVILEQGRNSGTIFMGCRKGHCRVGLLVSFPSSLLFLACGWSRAGYRSQRKMSWEETSGVPQSAS